MSQEDIKIGYKEVEVGKTYPLFGCVTEIISESPTLVVMINHMIKTEIKTDNKEHISAIKDRVFETGIFVTEITKINKEDNTLEGITTTVIYGKKQITEYDA